MSELQQPAFAYGYIRPLVPAVSILLLLSSCLQRQTDSELPGLAKIGEGGYMKGELIYALDDRPTPRNNFV